MKMTSLLAKHLREVHFGTNWTWSNMKDSLVDVTWEQAITPVHGLNTIAVLVYHTTYYINANIQVLQGGSLDAKDKYSFSHPPIQSQADWEEMLKGVWESVETMALLIEQLPDERLKETFVDPKYGDYFRNIQGIIEHTHYHLGQIVVIKKILAAA